MLLLYSSNYCVVIVRAKKKFLNVNCTIKIEREKNV